MIIEIDLSKYPAIVESISQDAERGRSALLSHLNLLDKAYACNHPELVQNAFKLDYSEFLTILVDAFTDYKGITRHHPVKAEAEAMEILEYENNPITILTANASAYDIHGRPIDKHVFLGHPQNVKEYLQGLLYAARYIPHTEYVKYLSLGHFDLLDGLKYANVEKLIQIQPALNYQKQHNLPIGKFMEGTGFFDCGKIEENYWTTCPSCQDEWPNIEHLGVVYCKNCKAGFTK